MAPDSEFRLDPLPNPPVPLPRVPGPKLASFTPTAYADDIEFIQYLGCDNDKDSKVWAVKINGKGPYALKMFYFSAWEYLANGPGSRLLAPLKGPQLYIDYFDPFSCECRVYGRLKDEGREDLAVKAHGYLLLTREQEAVVTARHYGGYIDLDDGRYEDGGHTTAELEGEGTWKRYEQHRGHPIRAIVKELVGDDGIVEDDHESQLAHLWPDLEEFRKLGILVQDVHIGNWVGEDWKIVDFSRAWTMYHPCFHMVRPLDFRGFRRDEEQKLEHFLIAWSNHHPLQSIDALESLQKIARQGTGYFGVDPTEYDWRAGEESAEIAEAYVMNELYDVKIDETNDGNEENDVDRAEDPNGIDKTNKTDREDGAIMIEDVKTDGGDETNSVDEADERDDVGAVDNADEADGGDEVNEGKEAEEGKEKANEDGMDREILNLRLKEWSIQTVCRILHSY